MKGRDPRPTKSDPDGSDFIYIMKVPVAYAQAARLVYACSYDLLDVLVGDLRFRGGMLLTTTQR